MTFYLFGNAGLESDVSQFGAKLGFEYEKLTDKNIIMNNKGIINDSIEHDGEIYICGGLGTADDSTQYLAKLSDTTKNLITDNKKGVIISMIEFNNELYICGGLGTTIDGTQYLAKLSDPTKNLITDNKKGLIGSMIEFNNELYVCGNVITITTTYKVRYLSKLSDLKTNMFLHDLSDGDHEKDSWRYTGDINSMLVVKEDSNNLALILGLSIGLGIPILVVIIFMYQKYMPRTKNK